MNNCWVQSVEFEDKWVVVFIVDVNDEYDNDNHDDSDNDHVAFDCTIQCYYDRDTIIK